MAATSSSGTGPQPDGEDNILGQVDRLWQPITGSFHDRFKGVTGIFLHKVAKKAYVIKTTTLPFFNKNGERALYKHRLNDRKESVEDETLIASLLEKGVLPDVRGVPIAIEGNESFQMLSAGRLTDCFFKALEREPNNLLLKASVETGLPGALLLHPQTPEDALRWWRDEFNQYHRGADKKLPVLLQRRARH